MSKPITIPSELSEMIYQTKVSINGFLSLSHLNNHHITVQLENASNKLEKLLAIQQFIVDLQKKLDENLEVSK